MSREPIPRHRRPGWVRTARLAVWALLALSIASCSDEALGDLGGRTAGWIHEVATTTTSTSTTTPATIRHALEAEWVNDELGAPQPDLTDSELLAAIFARSADESRFLQASRDEIAALVPEAAFPATLPVDVAYVTSQIVIESRTLRLARDPVVAFGMWSVEPYTRSRSVGQVAVLTASSDPAGSEVANDPDTEPTCGLFATGDRLCSIEDFADRPVWRLESEAGVVHIWYAGPFRYELDGRGDLDEEILHTMITSMTPMADLTTTAGSR